MKISYLLLCASNTDKIIKNMHIPACRNCVFYKPNHSSFQFSSTFNKCEKFGEKNIITNEITYDYADSCRTSENKCGQTGVHFKEETNVIGKIIKHKLLFLLPFSFPIIVVLMSAITSFVFIKK